MDPNAREPRALNASVALLRAVNVGGRSVPMAELRELFESIGATNVQSYIQSGNVVFSPPRHSAQRFGDVIEKALSDRFGLHSAVVVRTGGDLQRVLASVPYPARARPFVHVGFFGAQPSATEIRILKGFDAGDEGVVVSGRECFLYLPHGVGRAKLPARVNRLSTPVTIRNLRTVTALAALAAPPG